MQLIFREDHNYFLALLYLQVKFKARLNACILELIFLSNLVGGAEALLTPLFAPLYLNA